MAAAPGLTTWCEANGWRSAIAGVEGKRRRGTAVCKPGRSQCVVWQPWAYIIHRSPSLFTWNLPSRRPSQKQSDCAYPLVPFALYRTMAFVEMGSFYHYQPPTADRGRDGRRMASNLRLPAPLARGDDLTSLGPSKKPSRRLQGYDPIAFLDITGPPPEESLNLFHVPAPDLDYTEADTSNGFNITRGSGHSSVEEDGDFLPVEELLLGAGETQERQRTGSTDGHATGGSEGNSEPIAERDRNSAASPRSSEGEHQEESVVVGDTLAKDCSTQDTQRETGGGDPEREAVRLDQSIVPYNTDNDSDAFEVVRNQPPPQFKRPSILRPYNGNNRAGSTRNKPGSPGDPIVVEDDDTDSGDDGTSKEQVRSHVSGLRRPLEGLQSLDISTSTRTANVIPLIPLPHTTIPSRRRRASKRDRSKGGNCKGLRPDASTGRGKNNLWNGQEAKADKKDKDQERYNKDSDKKTAPSLGSTKKRRTSVVEGKFASDRHVKRHRWLSPKRDKTIGSQATIFAVQPDGTFPGSKGVQPKLHSATIPRGPATGTATSPPIEQAQGRGNAEEEWDIREILGKRTTVSGTEYMVRWENTWLPKGRLGNAQKLLREFEAKRQARHGRKRGRPA
ncbi:hypothetical protein ABVK25_010820 [Lepraria finkii]|uniref:Chromo domain-containing protein n=1 Tax=Lepraria finkii TaxID=1340010 RepID=A0ABR4ATE1_9LECA